MKRKKYRTSISLNNKPTKPKKNNFNKDLVEKTLSQNLYKTVLKNTKCKKKNKNLIEQNENISNFIKNGIRKSIISNNYPLFNNFNNILKTNISSSKIKLNNIKSFNIKSNLNKAKNKNLKSDLNLDILSNLKQENNIDNDSNSKCLLLKENKPFFITKKSNQGFNDSTKKTIFDKKISIKNLFIKEITENYLTDISKDIIEMITTYRHLFKIHRLTDSEQSDDDVIIIDDTSKYVIHPYNQYLMIYRIVIFFLIFYNILFYPLFFAFEINVPYFLFIFVDIVFIFDFFIGFFIGFFNVDGKLVNNLFQVCIYNLNKKFLTNFITDFPFSFLPYKKYNLLKILFIIRIFKFLQFRYKEEESEYCHDSHIFNIDIIKSLSVHQPYYSFIEFFIGLFIFIHLWSCIFILISKDYFPNWLSKSKSLNNLKLIDMNNLTIYLSAFYFVLTTIITVGYGDVIVENNTERIFDLFLMVFGVCIYSCVISILSSLFEEWQENEFEKTKEITVLDKLYNKYIFSNSLYTKILRFLKRKMVIDSTSKSFLINSLPIHYKSTLLYEINKNYLSRLNFFKEKSYDFQYSAVKYLKEINFIKKEYIVQTNDLLEEMYFIKNGVIEFQKNDLSRGVIKILKMRQNEHFGEIYMTMGIYIPFDIISISEYVELFFLKKSDFIRLYEDFPEIISKILNLSLENTFRIEKRAKMLFEKNEKEIELEIYKDYHKNKCDNLFEHEKNKNLDTVKEETFINDNDESEKYTITKEENNNVKKLETIKENSNIIKMENNNTIINDENNIKNTNKSTNSILNLIKISDINEKNRASSLQKKSNFVNLHNDDININKVSSFKLSGTTHYSKKVIFSLNNSESKYKKKYFSSNKNIDLSKKENKNFYNITIIHSPKIKEEKSLTFNEKNNNQEKNNLLQHTKTEEFNLPIIQYKKTNKDKLNKTIIIHDKKYKNSISKLNTNPRKSTKSYREKKINNINLNVNFNIQNNFKIEKPIKTKNSTKSAKKNKEKTNLNLVLNNLKGLSENLKNPFNLFKNMKKNENLIDNANINNDINRLSVSKNSNLNSNIYSNIPSNMPSNIHSNIPSNIHSNIPSNINSNIPSNINSNVNSKIHSNLNLNINNIYELIEQIDKISDIYDIILLNWKR